MPNSDAFPPILIEVQHTVDNDFILRLMSYGISAIRQHNSAPPIILTFVMSSIKYEVTKRTTTNKNLSSLLQYPCHPWAQRCYFVSADTITSSLQQPLSPFVALSMFLTTQHPSPLTNPYHDDSTMQQLYAIARHVFHDQVTKHQRICDDILDLCRDTKTTFE